MFAPALVEAGQTYHTALIHSAFDIPFPSYTCRTWLKLLGVQIMSVLTIVKQIP
jgi:hypothetical protein